MLKSKELCRTALIAALYVALTTLNPLSWGAVQFRIANMLCAAPFFKKSYAPAVLSGEVWRLVTFLFVPSGGSLLGFVLEAYFLWFIGTALEREWGDFRYNLYILLGALGAILAAFVTGWADTYCLIISLLLAFAALYPEMQVLLFFVLPIRVKYLGIFSGAIFLLSFISAGWWTRLNYLLCMLGYLVFFGPVLYRNLRAWYRREQWKRNNRRW